MKYVILHVDGVADQPRTELGGKTLFRPLQFLTSIASRKAENSGS